MKSARFASIALSVAVACTFVAPVSLAADAPNLVQDESKQKEILADLSSAKDELVLLIGRGEVFNDKAKREEIAPRAIPLLLRMIKAYDALQTHVIRSVRSIDYKFQPLSLLALFGDEKTIGQLKENVKNPDPVVAVEAGAALTLSEWIKSDKDAASQRSALDSFSAMAHDHPADDQLTIALLTMLNTRAPKRELHEAIMKIMVDDLKGPLAQQVSQSARAEMKLKELEGKPLVIAAKSLDGTDFSTAKWKGKVILVDFWASWCGPCKAELPRVKKAYADYHAKGFEVLGVSCDRGEGPLRQFLGENPDMPWPQLFDAANPGWHPLATGFGINSIPTMFLIDKNGVVKSITARENFEELIPKMLEEK